MTPTTFFPPPHRAGRAPTPRHRRVAALAVTLAAAVAVVLAALFTFAGPAAAQSGGGLLPPGDRQAQAAAEASEERSSEARKFWRPVETLNPGQPPGSDPLNRATPRAALANFMKAGDAGDWARAARVLDLGFLAEARQAADGLVLARKLHWLLDRKVGIEWDGIPDRRDGARSDATGQAETAPEPRRYIAVASLSLDGRPVDIQLERVKPQGREPLWVFPPSAVEAVPDLYEANGPSYFHRVLPPELTDTLVLEVPIWEWIGLLVVAAACLLLAWIIRVALTRLWWRRSDADWTDGLTAAVSAPLILLLSLSVFKGLIGALLSLTGPILRLIDEVTLVLIVGAATWLAIRLVAHFADVFGNPLLSRSESEDDPKARRRLTQISVGKRIMIFIVLIAGVGAALSYFEESATVGLSFLFSAGAFSVILGIAAQSVLSNILAGIQIAVTEPVRIGDNVVFDGQWGWVEEITYTYVTIRTWDKRRLVVPHSYFLSKPVENWSKIAPQMIMPIYLYADFRVPVEAVRQRLAEILEEKKDWDRSMPPSLYVTSVTDQVVELRALVSGRDPLTAWYLHAEVREDLVGFLQDLEGGRYLPRRRLQITDADGDIASLAPRLRPDGIAEQAEADRPGATRPSGDRPPGDHPGRQPEPDAERRAMEEPEETGDDAETEGPAPSRSASTRPGRDAPAAGQGRSDRRPPQQDPQDDRSIDIDIDAGDGSGV